MLGHSTAVSFLPTDLATALLMSLCSRKEIFKVASKVGTHP